MSKPRKSKPSPAVAEIQRRTDLDRPTAERMAKRKPARAAPQVVTASPAAVDLWGDADRVTINRAKACVMERLDYAGFITAEAKILRVEPITDGGAFVTIRLFVSDLDIENTR